MDIGVFMMPSHPPERPLREGYEWDLRHLELCDRLGFSEAWIGEHFTSQWEPNPGAGPPDRAGAASHAAR